MDKGMFFVEDCFPLTAEAGTEVDTFSLPDEIEAINSDLELAEVIR